jgi:hypothetical protein
MLEYLYNFCAPVANQIGFMLGKENVEGNNN